MNFNQEDWNPPLQSIENFETVIFDLQEGKVSVHVPAHLLSPESTDESKVDSLFDALKCSTTREVSFIGHLCSRVPLLVNSLRDNTHLRVLDCDENNIGPKGAELMSQILRENSSIEYLLMGGNAIEDEGVAHIADALAVNRVLKYLNIAGNEITDEGGELVYRALQFNITVTKVGLWDNEFSDMSLIENMRKRLMRNAIIRPLVVVASARLISRLGKHAWIRNLPQDLLTLLCSMLL